jgi:YrbI family 3-deoxy-D-manno-octulosonate 8-phosphate phosphatase
MSFPNLAHIRAIAFDFDGVFTDDRVLVSETGEESVFCSRSDGMGIGLLRNAGIHMIIISKEKNTVVAARAKKLSLEVVHGCDDKLPVLKEWMQRISATPDTTAYMGNDINDLECLNHVGCAIAPADAHPEALAIADVITTKPGGRGAIREVADAVVKARATRHAK